jgi:hypothetical protein
MTFHLCESHIRDFWGIDCDETNCMIEAARDDVYEQMKAAPEGTAFQVEFTVEE